FKPRYKVWDERLCLVPDGDLFQALSGHNAEIVTDKIESFTETGIRLESGQELEADIIVAATGLNVQMLGGAQISVDGEPVDLTNAVAYKGAMFSGVPNLVNSFGYINASWTLKADLIARYVTRLLKYMERHDYDAALPLAPPEDQELHPFVGLQSGYIKRASLPKQGSRDPWVVHQSWLKDLKLLLRDTVDDEGVRFFKRNPGKLSGDDATLAQLDGGSDLGSPQDTKPGVRAGARSSSS
ncbi:MAG: NAD(P)/FAD-dependent oxidoreductase, partial [Solirubrobacterales bacterium]|nr:NAD(P)/FAD-dependent oxidoreductase [Solirubrobacterales bacterium]